MTASRLSILFVAAALTGTVVLSLTGCPEKSTVQSAGEKIDEAADKVADTIDPKGPAEKAGRSIDRATGD
jgi:predicted small secreted protein